MLVGHCQHPSSPQPPERRSSVPPHCCPDRRVLTPEPQAQLGLLFLQPLQARRGVSLPAMLPSLSSQHLGAVSLCRGAAHASSAHWLGCRQEDLGGGCCWCPTAQLPLPALGAGVRGPGAVYFDFQENSTLWGASSAVSWPAGLPRGGGLWLGGWCRLHMTCQTLCVHLQPSSGPRAVLSWVSTLVCLFPWFCTPPAPQGSPFPPWPGLAQPSPAVVEGEAVTHPGHLSSAWLRHQLGTAEGFLLPHGVCCYRGFLSQSVPMPCIPALCPAGHGAPGHSELGTLQAPLRAGDTAGPPFELGTLRASLPRATSSQITQTQQLLSKPCKVEPVGREGAVGRHAAGTAHVPGEGKEAPGEAGQEDPNPTLGMTCWLPRAPALWGNKAFLGCSFSIFL